MALFQTSVLTNYLKRQDNSAVAKAYKKFATYFKNPAIQQNIRESKEEQYQEGFLRELFVTVLGYTLNPHADYNLTTELKNEKGAKKADGAILKNSNALAVIELKGTKTKDLESVRQQAFDYKANQTGCVFVITSNFEKLRFYVNNAVEHEEFDLFNLTEERFALLYLCLEKDNLLNSLPLKIKEESLQEEEQITKRFYADYSLFKRELFRDLVKQNMKNEVFRTELNKEDTDRATKNIKHTLFKKSQKLIDRFLFIFFAEDRDLLPPNSTLKILESWEQLNNMDAYAPLYDRFKIYFNYLDIGRQGTDKKAEIFAYNGGLFKPDGVLNSLIISDELLHRHTKILSHYDFASQVDVNILGHIFENSLNEIESVNAEIEGVEFDKQTTKRKKDGVFYTPKYITKYIVENTIGKLCEEKKTELGIIEDDYLKNRKHRKKDKLKELQERLDAYRKWLLNLTICDPACGSGAFLNQALDFLIKEHQYLDELQTSLLGGGFAFPDIENTVLENNIFGVDLNEESVEIAKLSLWLRTAQPRRKLNDLSSNIKCGNSLIDDKAVAGDKAFNWYKEFPQVFGDEQDIEPLMGLAEPAEPYSKKGFDVVIGNPPYLRVQGLRENFEIESTFYETKYKSATGRFDVYVLFIEKSFHLINQSGLVSFILPHKFLISEFGEGVRKFILDNRAINSIVHFGSEMIFADASTYTCIVGLSHNNTKLNYKQLTLTDFQYDFIFDQIDYKTIQNGKWNLQDVKGGKLFDKLNKQSLRLSDIFKHISQGVVSVGDDIFLLKGEIKGNKFIGYSDKLGDIISIEAEAVKPLLKGDDVKKYAPLSNTYYCLYPHHELDGKTIPFEEDYFKEVFPLAYNYILPYKDELIKKKIRYKTNPKAWYSLHRSREISLFQQEKIVTPETSLGGNMTIDYSRSYHNTQVYSLVKREKYDLDNKLLLAILNSNLFWFYLKSTGAILRGGYFRFKTKYIETFPFPKINDQQPFVAKADLMLSLNKELTKVTVHFLAFLQSKFPIKKLSTKLQDWYKLEFSEFLKELKKAKVQLSLPEEAEWMQYFNTEKQKAQELKSQITKTDNEIDKMVYDLYELTDDEIKIVEG